MRSLFYWSLLSPGVDSGPKVFRGIHMFVKWVVVTTTVLSCWHWSKFTPTRRERERHAIKAGKTHTHSQTNRKQYKGRKEGLNLLIVCVVISTQPACVNKWWWIHCKCVWLSGRFNSCQNISIKIKWCAYCRLIRIWYLSLNFITETKILLQNNETNIIKSALSMCIIQMWTMKCFLQKKVHYLTASIDWR